MEEKLQARVAKKHELEMNKKMDEDKFKAQADRLDAELKEKVGEKTFKARADHVDLELNKKVILHSMGPFSCCT